MLFIITGTSHGISFEDMDVAALLKEDTDDDAFSEQKVCINCQFSIRYIIKQGIDNENDSLETTLAYFHS